MQQNDTRSTMKMRMKILAWIITCAAALDVTAASAQPYAVVRTHGPVSVNCGAYRRPVVHYVWRDGRRVERVTCVGATTRYRAVRRAAPHRSWKKSAVVIGGATAAGAGVGALVGGGKGAAIGAAAGAGAGTAYEVHKRRTLRHRHRG
jgi:hypothetical protein